LSVCSVLNQADLEELEHSAHRVRLAARATVFVEGEVATSLYTVREGVVSICKLLPDGRRQIVGFSTAGDFLGMTNSLRHQFSAVAVNPVALCKFSRASFARFIDKRPHVMVRINEMIVGELNQAQLHMVLLGQGSAEEKIASFLIAWRDRLAGLRGAKNVIDLPMSRQDIADYLGLTIETVSRTLNRFERDGVIRIVPGGVSLLDTERAEGLAAA
jgi:CRP/FNR family transcriptional regulator, anaerobic regulatory protein